MIWDVVAWRMGARWGHYLTLLSVLCQTQSSAAEDLGAKLVHAYCGAWRGAQTLLLSRPGFQASADKKKCGWKVILCGALVS